MLRSGRIGIAWAGAVAMVLMMLMVLSAAIGWSASPVAPANQAPANKLNPRSEGSIPVAFLLSEGAVVIDFTGPWEVFQDTYIPGRKDAAFQLYTVAESTQPIHTSGGMTIVPDYSFDNAPAPKVIVIPAQS